MGLKLTSQTECTTLVVNIITEAARILPPNDFELDNLVDLIITRDFHAYKVFALKHLNSSGRRTMLVEYDSTRKTWRNIIAFSSTKCCHWIKGGGYVKNYRCSLIWRGSLYLVLREQGNLYQIYGYHIESSLWSSCTKLICFPSTAETSIDKMILVGSARDNDVLLVTSMKPDGPQLLRVHKLTEKMEFIIVYTILRSELRIPNDFTWLPHATFKKQDGIIMFSGCMKHLHVTGLCMFRFNFCARILETVLSEQEGVSYVDYSEKNFFKPDHRFSSQSTSDHYSATINTTKILKEQTSIEAINTKMKYIIQIAAITSTNFLVKYKVKNHKNEHIYPN